jgi:hypothetical protein
MSARRRTTIPAQVGSKLAIVSPAVDLWAPVSFEGLPPALLDAAARSDWEAVRAQLHTVMDAVTTDGAYGRALLQFVMTTDLPTDHVLDRYRASICVDTGTGMAFSDTWRQTRSRPRS